MNNLSKKINFLINESISRLYYSNRYFYQKKIRNNYRKRSKNYIFKNYPEFYGLINKINNEVSLTNDDSLSLWGDALFLYNFVIETKPRKIIEFGSGVSSIALAYACNYLKNKHDLFCEVVSIEENKKYLENIVMPNFPSKLNKYIDFKYSSLQLREYQASSGYSAYGVSFKNIPDFSYDLIYVDAPQVKVGIYNDENIFLDKKLLNNKPFDSDVLNLMPSLKKDAHIIIDQRIDTVWKLKKFIQLGNNWKYFFSQRKSIMKYNGKFREFNSKEIN